MLESARLVVLDQVHAGVQAGHFGVPVEHVGRTAVALTEEAFAEMMKKPESGFDAMDPANVSPLVVWLGSANCDVTGRMFEIAGGQISVADGWQHGHVFDKGSRLEPTEVGAIVTDLVREAPAPAPVYGG